MYKLHIIALQDVNSWTFPLPRAAALKRPVSSRQHPSSSNNGCSDEDDTKGKVARVHGLGDAGRGGMALAGPSSIADILERFKPSDAVRLAEAQVKIEQAKAKAEQAKVDYALLQSAEEGRKAEKETRARMRDDLSGCKKASEQDLEKLVTEKANMLRESELQLREIQRLKLRVKEAREAKERLLQKQLLEAEPPPQQQQQQQQQRQAEPQQQPQPQPQPQPCTTFSSLHHGTVISMLSEDMLFIPGRVLLASDGPKMVSFAGEGVPLQPLDAVAEDMVGSFLECLNAMHPPSDAAPLLKVVLFGTSAHVPASFPGGEPCDLAITQPGTVVAGGGTLYHLSDAGMGNLRDADAFFANTPL